MAITIKPTRLCEYIHCDKDEGKRKTFRRYNTTDKYCCAECQRLDLEMKGKTPKPKKVYEINKFSKQRLREMPIYKTERLAFLALPENKYCFIKGCDKLATTIEHTRGRKGYADDWARDQKITLYIDIRFWQPCCFAHNGELENNPELSQEYQLSKIHGGQKQQK